MAKLSRTGIFKGIPKKTLHNATNTIFKSLIKDAEMRFSNLYGFEAKINQKDKGSECFVKFFPYHYEFSWSIDEEKNGECTVKLDGKTRGRFWEVLFDMKYKLADLLDTQWNALANFSIGYITAKMEELAKRRKE